MVKIFKEKRDDELINEARELGVETEDIFPTKEIGASSVANHRLQERVRNAKNLRYARWIWIIALISSIAAVISAIAAWVAVSK